MFLDIVLNNIYIVIFLGLFIAGETVLIPAIYLSVRGDLDLSLVIVLSLTATIIADLIWYFVGKIIPLEKILTFAPFRSKSLEVSSVTKAFDKHALYILFLSKFVYGTRTIVQVLCGARHVAFLPYFMINFISLLILNAIFVLIAFTINQSIVIDDLTHGLWIALAMFAAIVVLFHYLFKKLVWKRWSQQ